MKGIRVLAALAVAALASVEATGLSGQICQDGTPSPVPTTTSKPTSEPTTDKPTPEPTTGTPSPDPTTTKPTPDPTTGKPTPDPTTVTPAPTTTAPPPVPVDCELYTVLTDPSPWSACEDDGTSVFYKIKVLGIKTLPQNGGTACPPETDASRKANELCPAENCLVNTPAEDTGEFGACAQDDQDGKYYKTKVLDIKTPAKNGGKCDDKDRIYTEQCPPVDCVPYSVAEDHGEYGECRLVEGKFVKSKVLGVKEEAQNGGSCDEKDRMVTAPCAGIDCEVYSAEEDPGKYGDCAQDETDGKYYKSKVLGVKKPAQYGGLCPTEAQRTHKELCDAVKCELFTPEEDPSQFGDCLVKSDGKYYRSKILGIKVPAQNGGADCGTDEQRTYSQLCEAVNCVGLDPMDDKGEFSLCAKDDKDGKFYQSRVLGIKEPAKNGGTCDEKDRIYRELCPAIDCEAYKTAAEDPGQFGECKPVAEGKYYQYKVLGIKTPAKYGGTECESEEKRTVSLFCPPVNCVPFNVAEDQGEYGECTEDKTTGKFYKSKVLGVKEEAKNGGTCLESERTVSAPCDGIDCEVYSVEEDPGKFGGCAKDTTDGKYYKSKVLGIKKPAQYGGLCPSETQRTHRELCPAVNCVPLTPAEDMGPFGLCSRDETDRKYYQSKVLGVKTDAQYGGTCFETDRTYRELCPVVDCKVYTPEEDPGQFGVCEDLGGGKYYRSKVLGIQIAAQYGGLACPSESERKFSLFCEPVNCKVLKPENDSGEFGLCTKDDKDGKFYQSKVLGIKEPAKNGGTCDEKDRIYRELCPAIDCEAYKTAEEDPGQFGECKPNAEGKYYQYKVLGIKTPAKYGGTACESEEKRTVSLFCPPVNCVPFNVAEDQGEYGDCVKDQSSGKFYKSKVLGVKELAKNGGACEEKDRTVTSPCTGVDCVVFSKDEDPGKFGDCTIDTKDGKYYKSKVLGIKVPAKYDGLCPSEAERTYSVLCPAVNCVPLTPADDKGPFGLCTKDDKDGKYYKSKVLGIKTDAQYGGTCLESDRTYRELCPPINCEVKTPAEDFGAFGDCKDNGFGKFYKSKILGIKVPAQYGGAACPSETDRTYSELCPPVNCELLTPAEDKGAFGPCTDDGTGKFYMAKLLGIKVPAKNGGTCTDAARTYKELCPAVPCVIYTPTEDPGPFGVCVKDTASVFYYKSKTLGIKTPAQYGGSCPPATDPSRQYKVQCPPVDCVVTKAADDPRPYSNCTLVGGAYYRIKVLPIITEPQYGGKACPSEADRTLKQLCPDDGYCKPADPFYDQCVPKLAQCGNKVVDTIYQDFEIELLKGIALWQCCDECTTTPGCVAYSFTPNSKNAKNNECSLKWKIGATKKVTGATSSTPKTLLPTPCSFNDGSFNTAGDSLATIKTTSVAECCDACTKKPNCKVFNLDSSGNCELKGASIWNVLWPGSSWRSGKVN